jgi:threonyl-tRNA synthetase
VHRSIVSTMERMVAHLLEVHDGALPVWLAPLQVRVVPIVDDVIPFADEVAAALRAAGLRVDVDDRDATLNAKVRDGQQAKVPYIAVVGRREATDQTVAPRLRDGQQLPPMPIEEFVATVLSATHH